MPRGSVVLVTGGAGFIGSHTCKTLAAAGYLPVTVDNLSGGTAEAVRWGPLERCDLRDRRSLEQILAIHRPAAVVHFAGVIAVGESVTDPGKYYDINVTGTACLLDAMRAAGTARLIYSSSAAVYGNPTVSPIPECHPLNPVSPYGRTKAIAEAMAVDYHRSYGISSIALRYFNAAGADPDGDLKETHVPETHLIPLALEAAAGNRRLKLFGTDFPTRDGTCVRDYVHVSDLADAHVLAVQHLLAGWMGADAINLGNGTGFTVREVIDTVERVTGRPVPLDVAGRRDGDPPSLLADCSRARRELGWAPRFPSLSDQVAHAWAQVMPKTKRTHSAMAFDAVGT